MKKILFLVDRWGWAYHSDFSYIVQESLNQYDHVMELRLSTDDVNWSEWDTVVTPWWPPRPPDAYKKCKVVSVVASYPMLHKIGRDAASRSLKKGITVCPSKRLVDFLSDWGIPSTRIKFGIPLDQFQVRGDVPPEFVVGTAGRWSREVKRFHLSVDICNKCDLRRRHAEDIPQHKMVDFYRSLGCLLVTSEFEGEPRVAIEASAHGVPVVMPPIGVAEEVIPQDSIMDVRFMANYLGRMSDDPYYCAFLGGLGRRLVEKNYDIKDTIKDFVELL